MGVMTPSEAQASVLVEPGVNDLSLFERLSILSALHENVGIEIHEREA